jgi:hypothetical protein
MRLIDSLYLSWYDSLKEAGIINHAQKAQRLLWKEVG